MWAIDVEVMNQVRREARHGRMNHTAAGMELSGFRGTM
jgi:hypothetical protein